MTGNDSLIVSLDLLDVRQKYMQFLFDAPEEKIMIVLERELGIG